MMKSLVVKFLCFVILLSFVACEKSEEIGQQQKAKEIEADDDKLPNLWDDEVVKRMVREILARDLAKENNQHLLRTRHRRDVVSTTASTSEAARKVPQTTRKSSATPKSSRKPVRQTQSNKNKNRVTQSSTSATTTRATVKPSTKPSTTIVTSTTFGTNSALKAKVRSLPIHLVQISANESGKNKDDDIRLATSGYKILPHSSFPFQNQFSHQNLHAVLLNISIHSFAREFYFFNIDVDLMSLTQHFSPFMIIIILILMRHAHCTPCRQLLSV